MRPAGGQHMPQRTAGVRRLHVRDLFRRADRHPDRPPRPCPARIDDVVGRLDHVEVVLDDQQRVPGLDGFRNAASSFEMSSKCRPVVGSSRM